MPTTSPTTLLSVSVTVVKTDKERQVRNKEELTWEGLPENEDCNGDHEDDCGDPTDGTDVEEIDGCIASASVGLSLNIILCPLP